MYDSSIILKGKEKVEYDGYGNEVITYESREVSAMPRGVYNSEFYSAAQLGLHPSVTFVLANRMDYQGEKLVEWEGRLYNVIRDDWNAQRDTLSLICEERVANG